MISERQMQIGSAYVDAHWDVGHHAQLLGAYMNSLERACRVSQGECDPDKDYEAYDRWQVRINAAVAMQKQLAQSMSYLWSLADEESDT